MHFLFHSMQLFLPVEVLNDVVLVLDDTVQERMFSRSLPSFVQVRFEAAPPLSALWNVSLRGRAYDEALYSNWLSDRYTNADIICTLDPDIVFVTRTALYSMIYWDAAEGFYKPMISCLGDHEGYSESHHLFNLTALPHTPVLHVTTARVSPSLFAQWCTESPDVSVPTAGLRAVCQSQRRGGVRCDLCAVDSALSRDW